MLSWDYIFYANCRPQYVIYGRSINLSGDQTPQTSEWLTQTFISIH